MKRSRIVVACAAAVFATAFACMTFAAAPGGPANAPAASGAGAGPGGFGGGAPGGGAARGGPGGGAARGGPGAGRGTFAPVVTGPAAPVPPEVAIPRPSADEITKINAEISKLVASDKSDAKPLLDKYSSLLTVQAPRVNVAATYTQTQQRIGARHEGFVTQAKAGNIDLLLEGDSITDLWLSGHKPVYDKYFGDIKTANFAISGDTTQGVLWGLKNGEGQGFQPKAIMMMIGTNNTGSNTGPEIAEGVGAVVLENRKNFPDAKILLLAIFPRGTGPTDANRIKNIEANKLISKLHDGKHVFYMDIGDKFLDDKGALKTGTFNGDNLHPADPGYEIWGTAVIDTLKGWLK